MGQPAPAADLPLLTDWLRARLLDNELTDVAPGSRRASGTARARALGALDALAVEEVTGLCHADPSPWNVLVGSGGLWLVDPRGLRGDPAYDIAVIALKARDGLIWPKISAAQLAKHLDVDPDRVDQWLLVADAARV